MSKENKDDKFDNKLKKGAEFLVTIVGGATGAVVGGAIAGPPGAILGTIAGTSLEKAGKYVIDNFVSSKQVTRVGAIITYAAQKIGNSENIKNSKESFEETVEQILMLGKDEPEKLKIPFIGNLLANLAKTEDESLVKYSNLHIRLADELSFTDYCILYVIKHKNTEYDGLRIDDYSKEDVSIETNRVLQMILRLSHRSLVVSEAALIDSVWVSPTSLELTDIGKEFYDLLVLDEIKILDGKYKDLVDDIAVLLG